MVSSKTISEIHDKWVKIEKYGRPIQISDSVFLLPFKCPLDSKYDQFINSNDQLSVKNVLNFYENNEQIEIKAVLDLTNTEKYYDFKDWGTQVAFQKFRCAGRTVPTQEYTDTLLKAINNHVDKFKEKNDKAKKIGIGIHCTHGVNRTGFIIISYLIQHCNYSLSKAFSYLENSRFPHKIDK